MNFDLKKPGRDDFSFLKPNGQLLGNRQFLTVRNKINKLIETNCPKETWQSLEDIAEYNWDKLLYIDFKDDNLNNAKEDAENLFGDMTAFCKINALAKTQQINEDIAKARLLKHHFRHLADIDDEMIAQTHKGESFMKTLRKNEFSKELTQKKIEQIIKKFDDVKEITNGQVVTLSGSRNLILKLQDKDLCQEYSRLFKEHNREKDMNKEQELKQQCEKIKAKIDNIIKDDYNFKNDDNKQQEAYKNLFVVRFISIL